MNYFTTNYATVVDLARDHLYLALVPLLVGLVLAVPIGTVVRSVPWLRRTTLVVAGVLFTIPSLALFVTVPSIVGLRILDPLNVVIALSVYSTALLVRAVPEALDSVSPAVVDAATAMGYTRIRRAVTVELPLALPVLVASVRVVAVTNISMVSVGSVIGIGGLGQLFTAGYQRDYPEQILTGIVAIVVLALVIDAILYAAGRAATPWTRAGSPRRRPRRVAAAGTPKEAS